MKKIFFTLSIFLAFAVRANAEDIKKPLVIYFSRGINTLYSENVDATSSPSLRVKDERFTCHAETIAEWIAEEINGDIFSIQTQQKYPVVYEEIINFGKREQQKKARPVLTSELDNLDDYLTIYFVYPNWWGDLPMPVYSFFEKYDFSGKKIFAVVISGGSGFSKTLSSIKRLEPEAEIIKGLSIYKMNALESHSEVLKWLRKSR